VPTFLVFGQVQQQETRTGAPGRASQGLAELIRPIAERVAAAHGLEVWDIQSRREAAGHVVRVFIDRPGPAATAEESVSIEDCARVAEDLGTLLDVEDVMPGEYTFEVSSPGLDRPLRSADDYRRFAGRWAKIVTSQPVERHTAFNGRVKGIEGDDVLFESEGKKLMKLPLRLISRARLEVEF
jgi:ribosome maturation factor RimP